MDFAHDAKTYNLDDHYMVGPSFMVKPVTKEMYYEAEVLPPLIPSDNLRSLQNTPGLSATYFSDPELRNNVHQRVDKQIDFNWNGGGHPVGVPDENFSARWEGTLSANESGVHKIAAMSDDGVRVWVENQLIIDAWKYQGATLYTHKMPLEKGKSYAIKVEYFQGGGDATISLGWEVPSYRNNKIEKSKLDSVYLPIHEGWYDYWTNSYFSG